MRKSREGTPTKSQSADANASPGKSDKAVVVTPARRRGAVQVLDPSAGLTLLAEQLRAKCIELEVLEVAAIKQSEDTKAAIKAARSTIVRKRLIASEDDHCKLAEEAIAARQKADELATEAEKDAAEARVRAAEVEEARLAAEKIRAAEDMAAAAAAAEDGANQRWARLSREDGANRLAPPEGEAAMYPKYAAKVRKGGFHSSHVSLTEREQKKKVYLVMLSKTVGGALAPALKPKTTSPQLEGAAARLFAPTASSTFKATPAPSVLADSSAKKARKKKARKKKKKKKKAKQDRASPAARVLGHQQQIGAKNSRAQRPRIRV